MTLRCIGLGCPVGIVVLEPKDNGRGFDKGEIEDAGNSRDLTCPYCGDGLERIAEETRRG